MPPVNSMTALESQVTTPDVSPAYTSLLNQLQGQIAGIPKFDWGQILQQSFDSPYFRSVSQGLLGALRPQEQQAQRGLSDMFRGAGMLNSTAFGQGMSNLRGQQGAYRNQTMANLAQSLLGSGLQAGQLGLQSALAPIQMGTGLLATMPRGQTTTSNIDMGAMLSLLQNLKGAMGGESPISDPWGMIDAARGGGMGGGLQQLIEALRGRGTSQPTVTPTSGGAQRGTGELTHATPYQYGGGGSDAWQTATSPFDYTGGEVDSGGSDPFAYTGGETNYDWSDPYAGAFDFSGGEGYWG